MRILIYPHDMGIGGSQLNAIELAAAVRALGHEVMIFGRPGALMSRVDELGLEFIESPRPGRRPSPTVARALISLVRSRHIDVVHGYEWPPALEGVLAGVGLRLALVATVMSMSVPRFIPRSVQLVVGTAEIAAAERIAGRRRVAVIEPPVDTSHNCLANTVGLDEFRARYALDDGRIAIVSVSRFAHELKLEGILTAIDVVGKLAQVAPVRLVLVGDGPARAEVERRAHAVNTAFGEAVIVLTGPLNDPRPAYAAADIALGMGGSALRALAYSTPLVVQGENGFWKTLTPQTVDQFLWTGWYGVGSGPDAGPEALWGSLEPLIADAGRRRELGAFGRGLVSDRFSLSRAAALQLDVYREAIGVPPRGRRLAEATALGQYSRYYVSKRVRRALGREALDDFNARPVTAVNNARKAPYGS